MMVRRVELLNQMLYSVILGWNAAPVPPDSPITGYEITVTPQDQGGRFAISALYIGLASKYVHIVTYRF